MKVGILQLNSTIGDFSGAVAKLVEAYQRACSLGAEFVVAPELFLCGYPPRDLLLRADFVRQNLEALAAAGREAGSVPLCVGFVDENSTRPGKPLRNSAAILQHGRVVQRFHKSLLPTYDVFDEARYFEPAPSVAVFPFQGRVLAITICEDIWNDEDFWPERLYGRDPVKELISLGADLVLNISASPWHAGKEKTRLAMLQELFSPDGRKVATTAYDRAVRVWSTQTGELLMRPTWFPAGPIQAHFSPDGSQIVTGFYNGTVQVWDAVTGNPRGQSLRHNHYLVQDATFSRDGRSLLTASHNGSARVWEAGTGWPVTSPIRAAVSLRAAGFLGNGERFFTRGKNGWQLWELLPGAKPAAILESDGEAQAVAIGASPAEVVVVTRDLRARVWSAESAQPLTDVLAEPGRFFGGARADETLCAKFVAAALNWERRSGKRIKDFVREGETVVSFDASADQRWVAFGFLDGRARVIDLRGGSERNIEMERGAAVTCVQFLWDQPTVILGSASGVVRVVDVTRGSALQDLAHPGEVRGLSCTRNGRWLVTWGIFTGARLWDWRGENPVSRELSHESEVAHAAFDPSGSRVVTASFDHTARVWEVRSGQQVAQTLAHEAGVRRAVFTPDGRRVVTGSADGGLRLWDAETGIAMSEVLYCGSIVNNFVVTGDGESAWCATQGGNAYRWEIREAPIPAPAWLPELAEALAGTRLREDGVSEIVQPDSLRKLEFKADARANDFYSRWARARLTHDAGTMGNPVSR